jgi:hypothetical protein
MHRLRLALSACSRRHCSRSRLGVCFGPLRYVFHYMVTNGLTYLCMSDTEFSRPLAFQFLNDIKDRFHATYGDRAKTAIAFAFNADFARVLQAQTEKYNSQGDPKIAKIRQQLDDVKDVMMDNIDRVLLRGEKIELLVRLHAAATCSCSAREEWLRATIEE